MKVRSVITASIICLSVVTLLCLKIHASDTDITDDLIRRYRQETKCKSVSVVVVKGEDVTYYGNSNSLYQIGSMTKAFTGLAIQKLINEGKIDESGSVSDYIPGFEAYYGSEKADVKVKDLLEQKSGYTNDERKYPAASADMTLAGWAAAISGRQLSEKPGTTYSYSNVNYNLLGLITENVSGMSYGDYMEQELLIPLGLKNTYAHIPSDDRIVEGTRLRYRHVYDYPIAVKEACIPAGYFYSNAEDIGRWIRIWTGSISVPDSFREPLSKTKANLRKEGNYYSGWELFAGDVTGHSGGTPNYSSRVVFSEKDETGVCVLSSLNVAATTDSLCNGIFDITSGTAPADLSTDIWTIFDRIFTIFTLTAAVLIPVALICRNRRLLLTLDLIAAVLIILIFIMFPVIFSAGMKEILFTWAPLSVALGLLTAFGVIAVITVKLLMVKKYEDHKKTG